MNEALRGRQRALQLEGGEDDEGYEEAHEEAALVGDGIDDRVFVEVASRGEEPEAAQPEEQDGDEEPEAVGVAVELGGVEVGDVEGEDDDGGVGAGGAEAAELFEVGDVVAAAYCRDSPAFPEAFEFREAFDEGERKEEEDAEAGEPSGDGYSGGGGPGEDADGVEAGEHDDIDDDDAFEPERVSERSNEVDERASRGSLSGMGESAPETGRSP